MQIFFRLLGAMRSSGSDVSSRRANSRLAIETLEGRCTPAVGAFGALEGNALTIVGDSSDNSILLRLDSAGQLTIDGGRFQTSDGLVDSIAANRVAFISVIAGAGNDTVVIDPKISVPVSISGGDGNDILVGGRGPTEIFGQGGDDSLYGGGGEDRLYGGDGNDLIVGGGGRDFAYGGTGTDTFSRSTEIKADFASGETLLRTEPTTPKLPTDITAPATPVLGSVPQPTTISAVLIGDVLQIQGTSGDDSIKLVLTNGVYSLADGTMISTDAGMVAGVAANRVRKIDVIAYDGNDTVDLSASRAATRIIGSNGADTLIGGSNEDLLFGGAGDDLLIGNAGNDRAYGGAGNDTMDLGAGNDIAYGGSGTDTFVGGAGRDRFVDVGTGEVVASDVELSGAEMLPPWFIDPKPHRR